MNDNLKIKGPQDPNTINFNQQHEIEYWTTTWRISETKLREAVKAVGNSVTKVKQYLGL